MCMLHVCSGVRKVALGVCTCSLHLCCYTLQLVNNPLAGLPLHIQRHLLPITCSGWGPSHHTAAPHSGVPRPNNHGHTTPTVQQQQWCMVVGWYSPKNTLTKGVGLTFLNVRNCTLGFLYWSWGTLADTKYLHKTARRGVAATNVARGANAGRPTTHGSAAVCWAYLAPLLPLCSVL